MANVIAAFVGGLILVALMVGVVIGAADMMATPVSRARAAAHRATNKYKRALRSHDLAAMRAAKAEWTKALIALEEALSSEKDAAKIREANRLEAARAVVMLQDVENGYKMVRE